MQLTSRERLTRLFNNQEIDRIPIWLLAPFHRLSCYADIYNLDCYEPIIKYIDKYCDTFDRRSYSSGFCFNGNSEIIQTNETVIQNGQKINKNIIKYKNIELSKYLDITDQGKKMKYFAEEPNDLKRILEIPYIPIIPDFTDYNREKAELSDKGVMMMDLGDPLGPLYHVCSAENFSMWSVTDYDLLLEFEDELYKRVMDIYKCYLDNDVGEVFFIVGAEFAGPPLVSPNKFNELSVRYVKGIVDLIRSYGKKSIVHYHGNLYKVLSGIKEINPDGLHTIEAPPIGDCTLSQARKALGNMILIGNIQYDDLTRLRPEEIDKMVESAIDESKSGRFILSPTAGPYENELSQRAVENYLAFIEAGIKYGS